MTLANLYFFSNVPLLILDKKGRLIGLAVPPSDSEESEGMRKGLEDLAQFGVAPSKEALSRGDFETIPCGNQFGGGPKEPGERTTPGGKKCKAALDSFMESTHMRSFRRRVAG
jgi:hypothetical protein